MRDLGSNAVYEGDSALPAAVWSTSGESRRTRFVREKQGTGHSRSHEPRPHRPRQAPTRSRKQAAGHSKAAERSKGDRVRRRERTGGGDELLQLELLLGLPLGVLARDVQRPLR